MGEESKEKYASPVFLAILQFLLPCFGGTYWFVTSWVWGVSCILISLILLFTESYLLLLLFALATSIHVAILAKKRNGGLNLKPEQKTVSHVSKKESVPVTTDPEALKKILEKLKHEEVDRNTELELNGGNLTARDRKRKEKIKEIEERLQPGLGTQLAAGGFKGGVALSMSGILLMLIGVILSITGIGAIIGIPLLILGLIMFLLSGIVAIIGIGSGATVGAAKGLKKLKQKK